MKQIILATLLVTSLPYSLAACPNLGFLNESAKLWNEKTDFASVEQQYPLLPALLASLTPKDLETCTQEQLDQIYARLTAGPIPDGSYNGTVIFNADSGFERMAAVFGAIDPLLDTKFNYLKKFAEGLWQGKIFFKNEGVLRNRITSANINPLLTILGTLSPTPVDPSQFMTAPAEPGVPTTYLLFPAKLYCGQSYLDSRRESVIIDYAYSEDIPGYVPAVDYLATRNSLGIRDEIRMIRPGFYLGRAYMQKVFGLTFTLYNPEVDKAGVATEECFTGHHNDVAL